MKRAVSKELTGRDKLDERCIKAILIAPISLSAAPVVVANCLEEHRT